MADKGNASKTKDQGKAVQKTGGDKGSKKSNDFEASGRDRNAAEGSRDPENKGRQGVDNEKARLHSQTEKGAEGSAQKAASKGKGKDGQERVTEAGVRGPNETKNRSQVPAEADSAQKLRKTSKGEPGSRKPGTELTKDERTGRKM